MMIRQILLLAILCGCLPVQATEAIQLKGLFGKKAALLLIDGEDTMLKVGRSASGVTLVKIVDKTAWLDVNGQQQQVSLSRQTSGGSYKKPQVSTVRIASQRGGHYWVRGFINGFSAELVVDTGATSIAMGEATAKRLGIDYKKGKPMKVSTANGISNAMAVTLKKVSVGQITQYNVPATVTLGGGLPVILLGNSFLSKVDMRTENGVLVLESRL